MVKDMFICVTRSQHRAGSYGSQPAWFPTTWLSLSLIVWHQKETIFPSDIVFQALRTELFPKLQDRKPQP